MSRPVQHFSPEYLARCRKMRPDQIVRFLDGFRALGRPPASAKSRLISMKVPEDLLRSFKSACDKEGAAYQTRIKELMRRWLAERDRPCADSRLV